MIIILNAKQANYTEAGLTSSDLHTDFSVRLSLGAHVYQDFGGVRLPVTIISDDGYSYEFAKGHIDICYSNNRSTLFFTAEGN